MNKSNMKRLGDYIRQVDVRNRDLVVTRLRGLSMTKQFRESTSNIVGVDLSKYKIVKNGVFAFDTMSVIRVHKVPLILNNLGYPIIISPAYITFEVLDETKLNQEYLFMFFKSSGFDRYADFKSDASVRGGYGWEELCDTFISVPPIEEQKKIVAEYQAVERRIENNRRLIATLEEAAKTIYRKMFVDNIDLGKLPQGWRMGVIGDFGIVITGKTPSSSCSEDFGTDTDFITPVEFKNEDIFYSSPIRKLSKTGVIKLKNKLIPQYGLSVTCIGSDMGKVRICKNECISNQQINSIVTHSKFGVPYLFYTLRGMKNEFQRLAIGSSTMLMLSKSEFENIKIILPSEKILKQFYNFVSPILRHCFSLEKEIEVLQSALTILRNKLSTIL